MTDKKYISLLEEYIEYVHNYPDEHEVKGNYPVSFDEWRYNDKPESIED